MTFTNFDDKEVDDAYVKNEKMAIGETAESRVKGLDALKRKLISK